MSAIVACGGGGGGGGSKGGSGSNSNNGGGQPTINVNVNSSNANTNSNSNANTNNNSNLNLNTNINSMMLAGLTLNLDANMLNTLKGIIDLPNSTIKIAGTNDVAKIQTNAMSGAMTLTFDNLKNIHAGQNVTLDINDGTHTASAIVNTAKGGGTTGTTTGTTGSSSSGTGANGGANPSGAGANNGNGHGSGQQQIELKIDGGVDKQTGNPIITTKPLTCKVDTIETPEHPQHNTGTGSTNGQQNQQNQQNVQSNVKGVGVNYGSINTKAGDALANRWANSTSLAQVGYYGLGVGAHSYTCIDEDPASAGIGGLPSIVTKHVYNMSISVPVAKIPELALRNTTYRILETNASVVVNYNATTTALDFSITGAECIPDGENATLELTDGINIKQIRMVAHEGNVTIDNIADTTPIPIIGNGKVSNGTDGYINVNNITCNNMSNMFKSWFGTEYNEQILYSQKITSVTATINLNYNNKVNPNSTTYCTLNRYGGSPDNRIPVSKAIPIYPEMFHETGYQTHIYQTTIKFTPANACETAFDYIIKRFSMIFCTDGNTSSLGGVYTFPISTTGDVQLQTEDNPSDAHFNGNWAH